MAKRSAYASAGVDLAVSNRLKDDLPALLASTQRPEVLGQVGGFGGLFALNTRKYKTPVLVSSVDGVGTKLKVAFAAKRHDTIGQDLVNHCVNDIAVIGAEPLFFLDYIGTGKLRKKAFTDIIRGFAIGCRENNCSLVGGETAQMSTFYKKGEYDVSGTIVGVVEKSAMLDGRGIKPGDAVIGIASSGLHTNGYSLARHIVFDVAGRSLEDPAWEGSESTLADELLAPSVIYAPSVVAALAAHEVHAVAHVTGGGLPGNLSRVLGEDVDAVLDHTAWEVPRIFRELQDMGGVSDGEMARVFNLGVGMVLVVPPSEADGVVATLESGARPARVIGELVPGTGTVAYSSAGGMGS